MFSQMVSSLQKGTLPEVRELEQRLKIALIKKMGILNQPYHCRSLDPKINPPALHLFWASIILEEKENIRTAEGILRAELSETARVRALEAFSEDETVHRGIQELINLAPDDDFRKILLQKTNHHILLNGLSRSTRSS